MSIDMDINDLFENTKFREHSIYFYRSSKSVTEVETLSDVSRTTIYSHLRKFKKGEYYDEKYITVLGGGRKAPYRFTQGLLIDWLYGVLGLDKGERKLLRGIVEKEEVDLYLRDSSSWYGVVLKLGVILNNVLSCKNSLGEMPSKEMYSEYMGTAMRTLTGKNDEEIERMKARLTEAVYAAFNPITGKSERAEGLFKKMLDADFPFEPENPVSVVYTMGLGATKFVELFEKMKAIGEERTTDQNSGP